MIKKDNYTFAGPKDKVYIVNSDDPRLENRSVRDIAQERGDVYKRQRVFSHSGGQGMPAGVKEGCTGPDFAKK